MPRALLRLICVLWAVAGARAATPMATLRIGRIDYLRAADVAGRLNLRMRWLSSRQLELADSAHRLELPVDGRDASLDGLRLFLGEPALTRSGQLYLSRIDYERRLRPLLRPEQEGSPPGHPRIIALDPGHGGSDHGTENPRLHLMEKTFTLDVAFRLKKLLEAQGDLVVMTRTNDSRFANDQRVDLPLRGEFANQRHADLFVSIHFNSAAPDTRTRGTEVFSFAPRYQRSSDSWQRREDDSEPNPRYPDLSPANRNDAWSVLLAHAMHGELIHSLHTEDRGEKIAHWAVLRPLDCPGILVESAFFVERRGGRAGGESGLPAADRRGDAGGNPGVWGRARPSAAGPRAGARRVAGRDRPAGRARPTPLPGTLEPPQRPS